MTDSPQPRRPWFAIAAMSENRVIGSGNQLPWNLPEDMKWVMNCTRGQAIAMGRKTFQSMGKPLPKRENIILSRSLVSVPGCTVLPSVEALLDHSTDRDVWIFGGAEIYRKALPWVHTLYLTVVYGSFDGDTFFPPFEDRFRLDETVRREPEFEIRRYRQV